MDENHYPMLQKALQYLDDNRIPGVHIISGHTSDPFFGQGKSRQYDRLDIHFSYQNNRTKVPCQVVFDSSDYTFSPDIIINPTWQAFSNEKLLLLEWEIEDPKCLQQWLSSLWIHFNQMLFGDEEYDELQSSREPTPIDLITPVDQPSSIVSAPAALPESSLVEQYQPIIISSNTRQTSSIVSFSDDRELQVSQQRHHQNEEAEIAILEDQNTFVEDDSAMDFEYRSLNERRGFIEQLISDMPK
ncbi:hypothetical protein BDC45DRAFT_564234 [Circinella umbellata]|nr:hypothetical protein BDC45DRAFT_564234 [Circinella umbellata]